MTRFIDIHHHLIYGLDDGAQTFEDTKAMLQVAKNNGVKVIAATPHVLPGIEKFDINGYRKRMALIKKWNDEANTGICLSSGSEVFYTASTERLLMEGQVPTLNGTRNILVEFNPNESFNKIREAVRRLGNAGYTVVIAHVERYDAFRRTKNIKDLKEQLSAIIQINTHTIIRPRNLLQRSWIKKVLKHNLCDVVATDAHNADTRKCCMKDCYELLKKEWGIEKAKDLCVTMPAAILDISP